VIDTIPANIEWSKIPPTAKVKDLGSSYVVTLSDGSRAVAFWGSQDRVKAQQWLLKRAVIDRAKGHK
jgi:hypothetical protein